MSSFKVNFDDLTRLGSLMNRAVSAIEGVKSTTDVGSDVVGDSEVADALHDFGHNWDHERGEFTRRAGKIAEMVQLAGTQYGDVERQLVGGMSESGGS